MWQHSRVNISLFCSPGGSQEINAAQSKGKSASGLLFPLNLANLVLPKMP